MTAELTRTTDFAAARRIAAPSGAPARFASVSGLPDVMRPAGPVEEIDRAMHHVALAPPMPATASADAAVAPVSVPLPVTRPETRIADGPIPGTVPAKANIISPNIIGSPILPNLTDQQTQLANQLSPSGQYRVLHSLIDGDTRGEDWTMTLTTIGNGQNVNTTQAGLGYA